MTYKIKQIPEDFIVEELPLVKDEGGNYSYFFLEKTNMNTLEAVRLLAGKLHINIKRIGWAGNKDKHARTKQLISIYKAQRVENLHFSNMKLTYFGSGSNEIVLGKLLGNKFDITIRNLDERDCKRIATKSKNPVIPNYFDEQRFSRKNPEIGKLIVQGKFSEAEKELGGKLSELHKNQLLLYVHSYQSLLFNRILVEYVKSNKCLEVPYSRGKFLFPENKIENVELPIIGFGTETEGVIGKITEEILKEEQITPRNFIIRQLPQISSEGTVRTAFVKVKNLSIESSEDDELNKGMKKMKISFVLVKGSYATIVVKALLI